jgi:hypothetical protein
MLSCKSHRLRLRLSLSALARMASVSRFRLWSAEHGDCTLTSDEEARIAEALRREATRLRCVFREINAAGGGRS